MGFLTDLIADGWDAAYWNKQCRDILKRLDDIPSSGSAPSYSLSLSEDTERKEQQKIRRERFEEEIASAIEADKQNGSGYSEEFYQQILQFTYDLYDCIEDFLDKTLEKYNDESIFDYNDISEVYASDYGSECYDYERQSKAKVSCKEAIKDAIRDVSQNFEEEKSNVTSSCEELFDNMENDIIKKLIKTFQDSFDDYVSLDCEDEAADYVQRIKDSIIDSKKLFEIYENLDILGEFQSFTKKLFDEPVVKLLDVQEYFVLCEYDEDDECYCYIMDSAIDELNERISKLYVEACDKLAEGISSMFQSVLSAFASGMIGSLIMMVKTTNS